MSKKVVIETTVEIVKAYVAGNQVPVEEPPQIFKVVCEAVSALERAAGGTEEERLEPAVAVRSSVKRDHIVCLEDGKKFKFLKGHLRSAHGLSPDQYRTKWGLGDDYPLVAPAYSARRAQIAVEMGLGRPGGSAPRKTGKNVLSDAA